MQVASTWYGESSLPRLKFRLCIEGIFRRFEAIGTAFLFFFVPFPFFSHFLVLILGSPTRKTFFRYVQVPKGPLFPRFQADV